MFRFVAGVGTEAVVVRKGEKRTEGPFCILKEPLSWDESWCCRVNAPAYLQHKFW